MLVSLTLLMMASGVIVAFAPNASVFMGERALIGIIIGGFWLMSIATVMRLVPEGVAPSLRGSARGADPCLVVRESAVNAVGTWARWQFVLPGSSPTACPIRNARSHALFSGAVRPVPVSYTHLTLPTNREV